MVFASVGRSFSFPPELLYQKLKIPAQIDVQRGKNNHVLGTGDVYLQFNLTITPPQRLRANALCRDGLLEHALQFVVLQQ